MRRVKRAKVICHFAQWQRTVYKYKPLDFPFAVAKKNTRSFNERSHERILFALPYERKDSLVIENLVLYRISAHYVKLVIRGVSSIYVYMYSTIYRFASPLLKFFTRIVTATQRNPVLSRALVISRVVGPRRARVFFFVFFSKMGGKSAREWGRKPYLRQKTHFAVNPDCVTVTRA